MQTVVKMKISKAGGNASSGSYKYMVVLPGTWVKEINISQDDRNVKMWFENNSIRVEKASENDEKTVKVSIVKVDKNFPDKLKYRISIPPTWAKEMGITLENKDICIDFSDGIFTITKHNF